MFKVHGSSEESHLGLVDGEVIVEDIVHDLDDGEGFAEFFGKLVGALCGADSLGDLLHGAEDIAEFFALSEAHPDAEVTALFAIAGDDEIANARKAAERHRIDAVVIAHAD